MAGEGSLEERGRSPLSKFSPPLKQQIYKAWTMTPFERGIQGVSINEQPDVNDTFI
jgi:hypothetical protein